MSPETPKQSGKKPAVKKSASVKSAVRKKATSEHAVPVSAPSPASEIQESKKTSQEIEAERYWEAVGRRKTAVARVRLFTKGEHGILVNGKPIVEYFPYVALQRIAAEAIETMNSSDRFRVSANVSGGGSHAQAEAIRHGTARALTLFNADFRKRLKRAGYLTRDPRMKERKKFGLKGARKAPQWAKR